jgi:hypothetical protein
MCIYFFAAFLAPFFGLAFFFRPRFATLPAFAFGVAAFFSGSALAAELAASLSPAAAGAVGAAAVASAFFVFAILLLLHFTVTD